MAISASVSRYGAGRFLRRLVGLFPPPLVVASRSDSDSPYKQEILAAARLHIARRIARFCTTLTPAEFERLLDRMVHIHWKYDVLPHIDPLQTLDHKSTTEPTLPKQP